MRAAVILALAALSSPTAVGSNSGSGSGSGSISGSDSGSGSGGAAGSGWDPAALHLFVDHEGLAEVSGLELVEHRPFKTYDMAVEPSEPWDGGMCPCLAFSPSHPSLPALLHAGGPMHGLIEGYSSVVQVSESVIHVYCEAPPSLLSFRAVLHKRLARSYSPRRSLCDPDDTFGTYGRFLCVAVSKDGGKTFVKPKLGLVEFDGSKQNNIVLGKQINSTGKRSRSPGVVRLVS